MKKIIIVAIAALAILTTGACSSEKEETMETTAEYTLANAEELHAAHPSTFEIPTANERTTLESGDFAKLIFHGVEGTERMWVRVTGRTLNGFTGELDNEPFMIEGLHAGATVEFTAANVIDIM